jgi:hypothetical protein
VLAVALGWEAAASGVVASAVVATVCAFAAGVAASALKLIPVVAIASVIKSALIPCFMLFSPCLLTAKPQYPPSKTTTNSRFQKWKRPRKRPLNIAVRCENLRAAP